MKRTRLNPDGIPVIWWIGTSTKHQKYSPLVQFDWCWKMSLENNFYPIAVLRVPGHSRSYIFYQDAARDLPAYQKLLDIFQKNSKLKPVYLLTQARDRLGRNALATQVEALCEEYKCQIWSGRTGQPMQENIGQIFASGMELTMSRAEFHQTQARRRGAVLKRVKEKRLPYGKPEYGYKTVRDERGKSVGVDSDPIRAPIRQLMDEWFIAGNSPVEIARRLQLRFEDGQSEFKAPEGRQWHENVIRRMLKSRYPLGEYRAEVSGEEIFVIGNHPRLRTPEQQEEIDRQFLRRERGTQRGNGGPTRYYGIAFCADCKAKMIRLHAIPGPRNYGIDYICSAYHYSLRTTSRVCNRHFTYEAAITDAIVDFFQQPVDDIIASVVANAPRDRTAELEAARGRLEKVRKKKVEAIKLKLDYQIAKEEFDLVLNELAQTEKDVLAEIAELEANQVHLPNVDGIRSWLQEMLSLGNLKDWLTHDDPDTIRSVLTGRLKVFCHQRAYKAKEPAPTVELCL